MYKFYIALFFLLLLFGCVKKVPITINQWTTQSAVDTARGVVWSRFISTYNVMYEYTDLNGNVYLPKPEECQLGVPNGLGWGVPIENSAMFLGIYLDGAINRWQFTKLSEDANLIKRMVAGLLLLSSVSNTEGFVARGVGGDTISHYWTSSEDQHSGWFYGLSRYLETSIPSTSERDSIQLRLLNTGRLLLKNNWKITAEPPVYFWGSYNDFDFRVTRRLFIDKVCYNISKDIFWDQQYKKDLVERVGDSLLRRIDIISNGLSSQKSSSSTWHNSLSVACLRSLWETEQDTTIKSVYKKGIEASAKNAVQSLDNAFNFSNNDPSNMDIDWRKLNVYWQPQNDGISAKSLALKELDDFQNRCPRTIYEYNYVREPVFASWLVSLSTDTLFVKQNIPLIEKVISSYKFGNLYDVGFFPVECSWWRIKNL